jgi:serine phosphatase RsbU (regulator of sigma subunit)
MAEESGGSGGFVPGLVVVDQDGRRSRVLVQPFPFDIGRAPGSALVLRDSRISRTHARIASRDGACVLEDAGSRHGVWVNGARITGTYTLTGGESIEFGVPEGYRLLFTRNAEEQDRLMAKPAAGNQAGAGKTNLDKLRAVLEVARSMESSFSVDEVLRTVVDAALEATGAERGFLLLFDDQRELVVRTARTHGGDLPADSLRVPRGVIQKALENRRELFSMSFDPSQADTGVAGKTVVGLELRSVVCVPVVQMNISSGANTAMASAANSSAGVLYMDSRMATVDLAKGNRELLQTLTIEVSSVLENARLLAEERGKQKIEEELAVARNIQQSLLPRSLPAGGWLRIHGTSEACHEVGGDYFDAIPAAGSAAGTSEVWSVVVADVAGKGTSSALMASFLQGVFLGASANPDMGGTLARVNEFLAERGEFGKYATVFYATIHANGEMIFANAGHCSPMLVKAEGAIEVLRPTSMPVGMLPGTPFSTERRTLSPGDVVVLYSDGVTEAQDSEGAFYGRARLRQTIEKARASGRATGCADLHAFIREDLTSFMGNAAQTDDLTLVVAAYAGEGAGD